MHLLCKVARNPPAAQLQNFSSGLHRRRRRRSGEMPLFFIIPPPSLSLALFFSLSHLIHISWRALEVWNCLKLIHYWIFSPRLKSLASLPHNSAPIDCLSPNISQGCTEHFFPGTFCNCISLAGLRWIPANGADQREVLSGFCTYSALGVVLLGSCLYCQVPLVPLVVNPTWLHKSYICAPKHDLNRI